MYIYRFSTPGTGLYDNLQKYNLPYPEAVFDLAYFYRNPEPFFKLAQELYPSGRLRPNLAHYFVRLLHEKNLLLRMYTQNIDGFERCKFLQHFRMVSYIKCELVWLKLESLCVFRYVDSSRYSWRVARWSTRLICHGYVSAMSTQVQRQWYWGKNHKYRK